ncbi:DUF4783 domain-containing protein [Pontibacter sp. BT310]|uniref:DUF4783 domain-containing protein n=1 Tax=Pontibacter populi TaxID=890055 RepID=A0ABS6X950_9BACT|nr:MULTISPECIES: DUF4783 domain-containing protein [Pontibacter]MBJ6117691.1 DUF4783 domain-containing protein [Pontibacter sp. BT310]MBR0570117.1 DUF4783 domain-containing protein [Microvirga sp. STS03]MBW3364543.1 DUF4783 domain-containing protein [Pontibacter populi]
MKNLKQFAVVFFLLVGIVFMSGGQAVAQGGVMDGVKSAMKVGSSKDLSRNFSSVVELTLNGKEATSYSNTQAEFVMKNFFSKNAPVDFTYSHQGSSDKGQQYAIGTYTSKAGSYTVLVRMKDSKIQSMNFIKD